jgi:hypothetical protein
MVAVPPPVTGHFPLRKTAGLGVHQLGTPQPVAFVPCLIPSLLSSDGS